MNKQNLGCIIAMGLLIVKLKTFAEGKESELI